MCSFNINLSTGLWTVDYTNNDNNYGVCYHRPTIFIRPAQCTEEHLDTCVHEVLHAAFPTMTEAEVARASGDVSSVLWELGWRKKPSRKRARRGK
jgi:hypothetical protein